MSKLIDIPDEVKEILTYQGKLNRRRLKPHIEQILIDKVEAIKYSTPKSTKVYDDYNNVVLVRVLESLTSKIEGLKFTEIDPVEANLISAIKNYIDRDERG